MQPNIPGIPGVQNALADGISGRPNDEIANSNLQSLVTGEWREQNIGGSDGDVLDKMAQPVFPIEYIHDRVWNAPI